ncbi:MAG: GNAT family N-acetyltransferase [Clostridiales bacterium]|jgi:predicted GNAT family N-acyltransferase|nr:GNAT family N-acetyltransferase [Clostridiales bacterium]
MITTKWLLGSDDLEDAWLIRRKVFIEEQNVPEDLEMDGADAKALTLVAYDSGKPVATGRLIFSDSAALIGRVATLKEERKNGYGDLIMRMLIRKAYDSGFDEQVVHAQIGALGFYKKLGFSAYGQEYLEAGIPHISMSRRGDAPKNCSC